MTHDDVAPSFCRKPILPIDVRRRDPNIPIDARRRNHIIDARRRNHILPEYHICVMANSNKPPSHQKRKIKRSDLFLEEKKAKHVGPPKSVDVSNPPSRSAPQSLSPHNKGGIERYKRTKIKNSALKLDDTCVLPLLRTSFVQDYLGLRPQFQ